MAKWILLLCGLLFSWSGLLAGEPDEGGIGGTGVLFDAPELPDVCEVPRIPDAPDSPEVPDGIDVNMSGASVPSIDVPSTEAVTSYDMPSVGTVTSTSMELSSDSVVVPLSSSPGSISIINGSQ